MWKGAAVRTAAPAARVDDRASRAAARPGPIDDRTGLAAAGTRRRLEWLLRIGVALCFVGHGAFGIIGKAAWLPYFAVAGVEPAMAWRLMPVIGAVDIAIGIAVLVAPRRALLAYAAFWAAWTALLRPLAGQGAWEFLERAGNYGVPIAFLVATGAWRPGSWRAWTGRAAPAALDERRRVLVLRILCGTTAALLIGHGGLGAIERKSVLAAHFAVLGLPASAVPVAGWVELALGAILAVAAAAPARVLGADRPWRLFTPRLPGAQLPGPQLSGVRLSGPRLSGPRLSSPRLSGPRLSGPRLSSPRLSGPRPLTLRPIGPLLLATACWKIATELLYPLSGAPVWEFVERGGSYVAPLAALVLLTPTRRNP